MKSNHKIHPFEYLGAHKLFEEGRFLLADEMGMFKTAQAIYANNKFRERNPSTRTLIVCPTSVREHWAQELSTWAYPRGTANILYAGDLRAGLEAAEDSTWTIVSYPLLSRLDNGALRRLKRIGFHHVIPDEAHNAKNPAALRTRSLKTLADRADFVSLLSGTPIPNTMSDLYVLMSLLDPHEYPFNPEKDVSDLENFLAARNSFIQLYVERPQAVKELLHRKMLRRRAEDYLKDHLPEIQMHNVEIPLQGRHLEAYLHVLQKEMNVGKKMMDLAKATLDPCLVDSSLARLRAGGHDMSDKYAALDEIVAREMRKKDGKVLIFTNLKTGIIDYLVESYQQWGADAITGDVSTDGSERENIRLQFQRNPRKRVLLATTTMNEGVDLTGATAVVDLTIPFTPAERHQRWKRSHRPGEVKKDKVDIYTLRTTTPGPQPSLDEALLQMLDAKERIVSYLLRGMQVSLEELKLYDRTEQVPNIARAITSPSRAVLSYYIKWRGIGGDNARKRMKRNPEQSQYVAELYPHFSMARNAAEVYLPVIASLEKKSRLRRKVDIACGPGMLGHFLDEKVIGVDISHDMLARGKKEYGQNLLVQGRMDALPLASNTADFALCSLAIQMTSPREERAKAFQEMHRILKHAGYAFFTLPGGYLSDQDEQRFREILGRYGFAVRETQKGAGNSRIDTFLLQRVHQATTDRTYTLYWKGDPQRRKQ